MSLTKETAAKIVQNYIGLPHPLPAHGWGVSGFIFQSPDKKFAYKVYRTIEGFSTELAVYRRLRRHKISNLHGLNIPKIRGFSSESMIIKMDFVLAPYLLDFAGASLTPPDFSDDVMEHWHRQLHYHYGNNTHIAYAVYESLKKYGIFYMDFRQSNMNLTGLPGLSPPEPPDGQDDDQY